MASRFRFPRAVYTVASRPSTAAWLLVWTALGALGCESNDSAGLACPILAPGALASATIGATLDPGQGLADATGQLARGEIVAHAVYVPAGMRVSASVSSPGARIMALAYGPRDGQGGFPTCAALELAGSDGGSVSVGIGPGADGDPGEYLVLVTLRPGDGPAGYRVTIRCASGCDDPDAGCPTLAARGCPAVRCDGELARDGAGCLTCACDPTILCASTRAPGPWGTCTLPACRCPEADAEPVCGADGRSYPSRCEAACRAVPVARIGRCEDVCAALADCDDPCWGLRRVASDGCPSCACRDDLPEAAAACAGCPIDGPPVCGSDGVTYGSRCHARCAGAQILYAAACVDGCRDVPAECELDCDWGLAFLAATDADTPPADCLTCACATPPAASCVPRGVPVCAEFAALPAPTDVGSPCLALALGAHDARWGSCGAACDDDASCGAGARCITHGPLAGRCRVDDVPPCGCSSLQAPVCGADDTTYTNACAAACAGVAVALSHGSCCADDPAACDAGTAPTIDRRGCPSATECRAEGTTCRTDEPLDDACTPEGAGVEGSACAAHGRGIAAAAAWCAP